MARLPYDPMEAHRKEGKAAYAKKRSRKTVKGKPWKVTKLPNGSAVGANATRQSKRAVGQRYGA